MALSCGQTLSQVLQGDEVHKVVEGQDAAKIFESMDTDGFLLGKVKRAQTRSSLILSTAGNI